jgi:hypothetical protein
MEDLQMAETGAVSTYRLGVAHLIRVAGSLIVALGVIWLVGTLLGVGGPGRVVLAVLTLAVLIALVVAFARPPRVLTLDHSGYQVRWVRGAGRPRAAWREVAHVTTRGAGNAAMMQFELTDGESTTVPLTLLGADRLKAQREVHDRLNSARGYRKLDRP